MMALLEGRGDTLEDNVKNSIMIIPILMALFFTGVQSVPAVAADTSIEWTVSGKNEQEVRQKTSASSPAFVPAKRPSRGTRRKMFTPPIAPLERIWRNAQN